MIFTSADGKGFPTEPGFLFSIGLKVTIGDVSVRPYPSRMVRPRASRSFMTSGSSFAPPQAENLNRSPRALWTDLKIILPGLIENFCRRLPQRDKILNIIFGNGPCNCFILLKIP